MAVIQMVGVFLSIKGLRESKACLHFFKKNKETVDKVIKTL